MQNDPLNPQESQPAMRYAHLVVLLLIVAVGAYLRFSALGERSLWADEFATWHVSRMPLAESLRWQPELTKPPLYQFFLRLITNEARPTEWMLRLPAAIAGVLSIPAAYLLACMMTCRKTALSLAALMAINLLQIDYSQEARPYSMLVLGTILSTWAFLKLNQQPNWQRGAMYAVISALSFHSHYLSGLVIVAHAAWFIACLVQRKINRPGVFVFSWGLLATLCAPILIHCLRTKTSTTQGLSWIEPITWSSTIYVLTSITSQAAWVWLVLAPTLIMSAAWCVRQLIANPREPKSTSSTVGMGILISWFAFSFFGLVVISLWGQPAMLVRYALPAAVPALFLPLMMAKRIHRNAPIYIALIFVLGTAPDWITRSWQVEPGFRELATFVEEQVNPDANRVALVIDNTTFPEWEDVERLPLAYYPIAGHEVREIQLDNVGRPKNSELFKDARPIYLIVFRSDPIAIAKHAGVAIVPIRVEGVMYDQLLFSPYRLAMLSNK